MGTLDRDTTRIIGRRGKVWLVGAGPGDPDLLTVRAARLIAQAQVLAYDELVSPEILALAPADAELIAVGRRANGCRHHEARIHPLVVVRALEGRDVVRLKGGDPFVFGRGGEEAEELAAARVPFEVVPGISAALGAAAATNVPLTHRECASSVTFATAHAASADGAPDLSATIPREGTVVLYMGLGRLAETCAALVAGGRSAETPVAVVSRATLPDQRTVRGTLADIAERVRAADLPAPALVIVGPVVARAVASPAALASATDVPPSIAAVTA
jgi:uroporphyrin-III C-methyltransferase/precorrin-2 dehydrogenase/sirohydrochlorin ferrochelatase